MLEKKARILIIAIAFIISLIAVYLKSIYIFIPSALLMVYMTFAYFKFASVSLAFKQIRQKKLKSRVPIL